MVTMRMGASGNETRSPEQLYEHYLTERELADTLRHASKAERSHLYGELYDQLYSRVPHHPNIARKTNDVARQTIVSPQMQILRPFLKPEHVFLEIGPGNCGLSFAVADVVRQVYAVDVSAEVTSNSRHPQNFELLLSDGCSIPVAPNSIDVAFSNQLMEHLHVDDAREQVENIFQALKPGGVYICLTPNRLNGPHDISKYFDEVATGFHMKEYTVRELSATFLASGFAQVRALVGGRGIFVRMPAVVANATETGLERLPRSLRRRVARLAPARALLGIRLIATK